MTRGQLFVGAYAVGVPCDFKPEPLIQRWTAVACFTAGHPLDMDADGLVADYTALGGAFCHVHGFVPGVAVVRTRQMCGRFPRRGTQQHPPLERVRLNAFPPRDVPVYVIARAM